MKVLTQFFSAALENALRILSLLSSFTKTRVTGFREGLFKHQGI
jgi:hypothetical protein